MEGGSFFHSLMKEELCAKDFELGSSARGKKRRLTISQVQSLERSFEMENNLERGEKSRLPRSSTCIISRSPFASKIVGLCPRTSSWRKISTPSASLHVGGPRV
ncbi:unnamed protein product [Linum trigynum]|uniref:Uncharacterized protein n=1 Tax=Linum trigynum TaxID=586398 RepID=A0AAV2G5D7_9ROSI